MLTTPELTLADCTTLLLEGCIIRLLTSGVGRGEDESEVSNTSTAVLYDRTDTVDGSELGSAARRLAT